MTDFPALIRALAMGRVEFILVDGVAATVHGSARLTRDLDAVYRRSDDNIRRLVAALKAHGVYMRDAPPGLPFEFDEDTVRGGLNFTLTCELGDLDLFGEIPGGRTYEDLLSHTIEVELFGMTCLCLDLPKLIEVKRAAGRPQDLEVIAELERILEERNAQGTDPTAT